MWGIIPAAGAGSRIQPLGFPKELLPVGQRGSGQDLRPKAVMEYLLERMTLAKVDKLCVVVSPTKLDLVRYFGSSFEGTPICYLVQPRPRGLCDALFRAEGFVQPNEQVLIGLPDTLWFPADGLARLPAYTDRVSLLLFRAAQPSFFDAVVVDAQGRVSEIQSKDPTPKTDLIWGALRMPGQIFHSLALTWHNQQDEQYLGPILNTYLNWGGSVMGFHFGEAYVDVGNVDGFRTALDLLRDAGGGGGGGGGAAT